MVGVFMGSPDSSVGKESAYNAGDPSFVSWVGKICWRRDRLPTPVFLGFPCGSAGKVSTCNAGEWGSIPGLGRFPGDGKGYPLQYSGLENLQSQTQLSDLLTFNLDHILWSSLYLDVTLSFSPLISWCTHTHITLYNYSFYFYTTNVQEQELAEMLKARWSSSPKQKDWAKIVAKGGNKERNCNSG